MAGGKVQDRGASRQAVSCRSRKGELCMEELLMEAGAFVQELGNFSLREATRPTVRQERALIFLWNIFRGFCPVAPRMPYGLRKPLSS